MKIIKKQPLGNSGYRVVEEEIDIANFVPVKQAGVKYVFNEEDINSLNKMVAKLEQEYLTEKDINVVYKFRKKINIKETRTVKSAVLNLLPYLEKLKAKIETRKNIPKWYVKTKVY